MDLNTCVELLNGALPVCSIYKRDGIMKYLHTQDGKSIVDNLVNILFLKLRVIQI